MPPTTTEQVLDLVKKAGVFRPRDLGSHGIPREYLIRLCRKGLVQRVGRGLYTLVDSDVSEHLSMAEAAKKDPSWCHLPPVRASVPRPDAPGPI